MQLNVSDGIFAFLPQPLVHSSCSANPVGTVIKFHPISAERCLREAVQAIIDGK